MKLNITKTLLVAGSALLLGIATLTLMVKQRPQESARVPDFTEYAAGPERKQAFFDYFLPLVQQRNAELAATREELLTLRSRAGLGTRERERVAEIAARYRISDFDADNADHWELLLRRVDVVPPSLALAQAANESAWGTSRFAQQGNNFFGQWCFEPGCGIVPKHRDAGKTHEVASFESPAESVNAYIRNLNRNSAFKPLRDIREELREDDETVTGVELAEGLQRYSERGDEYIAELQSMIRYNKLQQYDRIAVADDLETSG